MKPLSLGLLVLLAAMPARAATHVWTGSASDRFSDAANWTGGSPAGDAEAELLFPATTGSYTPQNDIDGLTVRSISISSGGYTIGGKAISILSDFMLTIGEATIACDLVLAGDVAFFVDANVPNGRPALNLDGAIRGSGRLIKRGDWQLAMRGRSPNSYTGETVVERGRLLLQKGAGVTCIPGDLRIVGEVVSQLPEQIADHARVTFDRRGMLVIEHNETIGSVVALGNEPTASAGAGRVSGSALFVRGEIRASGNTELSFERLHLAQPLTVNLEGAAFSASLEGDAPVTVRSTSLRTVSLKSSHRSPTVIENARTKADLPNSPVVQRGGEFSGKARSLRLEGGALLPETTIGGELYLTSGTSVYTYEQQTTPIIAAGPVTLGGAKLLSGAPLQRQALGTIIPVIRNGSGPVIGTFAGLPEGAVFEGYTITYRGGDGNDVELRSPAPTPDIRTTRATVDGKVRLTFTVAFSQIRATGTLSVRHNGQLLGSVQLANGVGTLDLALAPALYALDLEYSGDSQLTAQKAIFTVTVLAPTPLITSVEPTLIKTGSGQVTVTIRGSNFIPGARPSFSSEPAEYISSTELRWVATSLGKGLPAQSRALAIVQGPGSQTSNSVTISFEAGPPEDPKRLTFTTSSITATVRPGATVAMAMAGYVTFQFNRTMLTDSDRDGKVIWQLSRALPAAFSCAVVDIETGESFIEATPNFSHDATPKPVKAYRGPSGAYSNIGIRQVEEGQALWVRRGVGAWFVEFVDGNVYVNYPVNDADWTRNNLILFDTGAMRPVGSDASSPAVPAGIERGDLLIPLNVRNGASFIVTVDDSHLAPDVSGTLELEQFGFALEEDGLLRLTLFRQDGSAGAVSARVTTFDKTAKSGIDYEPFDQRVRLEAGEMWTTVEIRLIDDALFAGPRAFGVRLSEPVGVAIAQPEGEERLLEAEQAPVVSVDDVTVIEGDGPGLATTTLHLTGPTRHTTEVEWVLAGQRRGKVAFAPGETRKEIQIPFTGDRIAAQDVTTEIILIAPLASRAPKAGYLRIIEDDVPRISVRDASVAEGSGTRTVVLTLDLDIVATRTVRVNFATRDGSATAGTDYTATSGVATFSTFETANAKIEIPILGDATAEGPETFEIVLSNPSGGQLARPVARVTIADDDAKPTISIADWMGIEGQRASFVVHLSAPAAAPVTVSVSAAPGTATDADFGPFPSGTATIPAGVMAIWLDMPLRSDVLVESDETFTITLSNPVNATLGRATATATILDRAEPSVIVSIGDVQVVEGDAGEKSIVATVSINRTSHSGVRVAWSTADGTATAGSDYLAAQGELTFLPGESAKQVTIVVKGDTLREPDETFRIVLANAAGATMLRPEAIVTVVDDEGGERRRAVKN